MERYGENEHPTLDKKSNTLFWFDLSWMQNKIENMV